jgi:thiol-disulfide isomerase/thioredoxin
MKARSPDCAALRPRRQAASWLAGLAFLAATCAAAAAEAPLPELGYRMSRLAEPQPAPEFTLNDMDGKPHALRDYRGRVVFVNFWATWCPPCRRELPSLEEQYGKFKGEPFTVLALNEWEDPEQAFIFMGQLSVFPTFPVLYDRDGKVAEAYKVKGLPTTLLLDKKGRMVYRAVGGRDFNHPEVEKIIRALIAEPE